MWPYDVFVVPSAIPAPHCAPHSAPRSLPAQLQDVLRSRNSKVHAHLVAVCPRVWEEFAALFDCFFEDIFSPEDVLAVVASFLVEGNKVLYRYAIGLLKVHQDTILAHTTEDKLWSALLDKVRREPSMPEVRAVAFKLWRFGKRMLYKLQGRWMMQLRERADIAVPMATATTKRGFRGMVTAANDGAVGILLGPPNRPAPAWLSTLPIPATLSEHCLRLMYTTEQHGWGLERLFSRCRAAEPVLLLVRAQGALAPLFGAFAFATLEPHHGSAGDGRTFVFTATPDVHAFPWVHAPRLRAFSATGMAHMANAETEKQLRRRAAASERSAAVGEVRVGAVVEGVPRTAAEERKELSHGERARREAEDTFLLVHEELLAVGASAASSKSALRLPPSLEYGTSETCDTFRNAPLHGDVTNPRFEIDCVEVYCFHTTALKRHASEPIK